MISYLEFVDAIGLTLTPAQRVFAGVAFDGLDPTDTEESRILWGPIAEPIPAVSRRAVAAVCGRGSGKSLLGGTRVAHLAATVDVSKLRSREIAFCPVVSPDKETAQQVVRFALDACEKARIPIVNRKQDGGEGFTIVREGGRKVRVETRSASVGGASIRGRSMPAAVLDEVAFFRDRSHRVNDQDIFDALRPRIMTGGQIILLSSPWIESGLLYEMWVRNYGHPVDALVAKAPTSLMRSDDKQVLADVEAERSVDPEKCARERDAEFMTSNATSFFDARAIAQSLSEDPPEQRARETVAVGGDFAFTRNSSAFVAVRVYPDEQEITRFEVVDLLERRPEGKPLKPSVVCAEAADFALTCGTDQIVADGYNREAVTEHLTNAGVNFVIAPAGNAGKNEVFGVVRTLLHEGLVTISTDIGDGELTERLKRQLREVIARPLSGGGRSIESPLWGTGEHGDLVSAFVLAVWRANKLGPQPDEKELNPYGIDEHERREMELAQEREDHMDRIARLTGLETPLESLYSRLSRRDV